MFNLFKKRSISALPDTSDADKAEAERMRRRHEQLQTMKKLGFTTSFDDDADLINWHRQFELLLELRTRIERLEDKGNV